MITQEYFWKAPDGTGLYALGWIPDEAPRAVITLVHGFMEHSERYTPWAAKFVNEGYAFISMDLRGHGKSEGKRGYIESFRKFIDDTDLMLEETQKLFPSIPVILYGHSMGGSIVINYLVSTIVSVDRAIVTSPWLELEFQPPVFKQLMARILQRILPHLRLSSNLDTRALSRDPRIVERYNNDPLVHNRISIRMYYEITRAGYKASRSLSRIAIPVLLIHGSSDRITSCRKTRESIDETRPNITYKEWPGGYHELHNDSDAVQVFDCIKEWLEETGLNNKKI
jgi:acylglycerol lipase